MGLLTKVLIASAIKGAVAITENVAEAAIANSNARAAEANARAAANRVAQSSPKEQQPNRTNTQNRVSPYELNLFYAKVAIISFIAKADKKISREEKAEFEQMLDVACDMYGDDAAEKAEEIYENTGNSFIAVETYLQKIQERDLESIVFYANEIARADKKLTPEEDDALKKIRSYIDSRKGNKEFHDLICTSCGGHMRSDSYGYKAVCEFCGLETIINSDNSPQKARMPSACGSCGKSLARFDNSKIFKFCPYCGGDVFATSGQRNSYKIEKSDSSAKREKPKSNGPNLYISYSTINPAIGMVTRIVSTGVKNTYINGQTISFHLLQGHQTIILKIGLKNYSREIYIPADNSPVRIYASYNGRAQISIDQPPY